MAYEKRVCVMKQMKRGFSADGGTLSGVVYLERLGEELTVTPRLLGLSPLRDGRYVLVVHVGDRCECLDVGTTPAKLSGMPSLRGGVSVLLCFVRADAEPIAYGSCGDAIPPEALLSVLTEAKKRRLPVPLPPYEIPTPGSPAPLAPGVPLPGGSPEEPENSFRGKVYDDEAIAAADYYARECDENGRGEGGDPQQEEEGTGGGDPACDAPAPLLPRGSLTYYNEVRERLEEAMKKFPSDGRLKGAFPHSDWVKTDGALLGIVYEEGIPRYLCVAVERKGEPPADMGERAVFVPAAPYSEEGFWVVFQDADTGETVQVSMQ